MVLTRLGKGMRVSNMSFENLVASQDGGPGYGTFLKLRQALRSKVWGQVLSPTDGPAFDDTIKLWATPVTARTPAVIVQPRGAKDVQLALKFAKQHELEVSVKGAGHSAASVALVPGGLVIDMSLMRGVFVNAQTKTAVAQGGCLLGDIDSATAVYDLAVPLGNMPYVGMGLALHGGVGVLKTMYGTTAQHIIAATVVLADGSMVDVDRDTEPDLLWGLRGAGSALGVVTSLTFRLHDMSNAYSGLLGFPDDPEHKNWRAIANFMMHQGRQEPGYSNNMVRVILPTGQPMLLTMITHVGLKTPGEKAEFLAPLLSLGPVMNTLRAGKGGSLSRSAFEGAGTRSFFTAAWLAWRGAYADMQSSFVEMGRKPVMHYEHMTGGHLPAVKVTDACMDTFCRLLDEWPDAIKSKSMTGFDMWRGPKGVNIGYAVELEGDTGPSGLLCKDAEVGWFMTAGYFDAAESDKVKAFVLKVKAEVSAHGGDTELYVNNTTDLDESKLEARVGGADKLARLRALKARVDPDNVLKSHLLKGL